MDPHRAEELVERYLSAWRSDVLGYLVPGTDPPLDVWAYAAVTGTVMVAADPGNHPTMRRWSRSRWTEAVNGEMASRPVRKSAGDWIGSVIGGTSDLLEDPSGAPDRLTKQEALTWGESRSRVGTLVTNLSTEARGTIRELVDRARSRGWHRGQLMAALSGAFVGFERDWLRVARTELQAAHNEAVAAAGAAKYGPSARVARVPERDGRTCEHCLRLYLDASGRPKVWALSALLANGTNHGRKPDQWLATLYPLHANCRCGTVVVPPGYRFDASWNLVK